MAGLVITANNEKKGLILEASLGKKLVIGRDADCDVSLPEVVGLSRQHCCITYTQAGFTICDMGSTNGTFADTVRLTEETIITEGTKYKIGEAELQVIGLALLQAPEPQEEPEPKPAEVTTVKPQAPEKKAEHIQRLREDARVQQTVSRLSATLNHQRISVVSVILVLIISFYIGLALYSAMVFGNPLPLILWP
jgi:pSer/pThr/pTyr-binding forkhead associated (FHA) protein